MNTLVCAEYHPYSPQKTTLRAIALSARLSHHRSMNYNKVLDTIQDELDYQLSLVARDAVLTALANVAETSEDLVRWIEMESELRQRFNPTRAEEQSISRMTRMRIQEYERERSRGVGA